ncbi:MAG: hypothetical protein DDT35_00703 [Firmicutes bacterium]|nr:hypothetical protein [Bacillota bacterium]
MLEKIGASRRGAPHCLFYATALVFIALATALFPYLPVLIITVDGKTLWAQVANYGDEVVYSYLHSVERTRVSEFFRVEGGMLRLVKVEMSSLGAGLPATNKEGFAFVDGKFVVKMDAKMREIPLLLHPATLPTLTMRDAHFDLTNYPAGTKVMVRFVRRPLLWLYLRRIMP